MNVGSVFCAGKSLVALDDGGGTSAPGIWSGLCLLAAAAISTDLAFAITFFVVYSHALPLIQKHVYILSFSFATAAEM